MEHNTKKFRAQRQHGRTATPGRKATARRGRSEQASTDAEGPAATVLAKVISEVLPQYGPKSPPVHSAELYADLFIDSRRFLMIIRGLERTLGFEIDDEDLLGVDLITYGDLVMFVNGLAVNKSDRSDEKA